MKHEIFLVDAERRNVRVLEVALRSAGYSVRIAGNGVDALEKVRAAVPDVLVTDSQPPKLDGYALIRALRESPEGAQISTIVLTEASEDWGRWHDLGGVERLIKPVFVRELVACVGLLVARRARARIVSGSGDAKRRTLTGSTEDLAVVDLLQSFEMLRESGVLRLQRRAQHAEIHFRDGRAVDASAGRLRGDRAVYALLGWNDATFEAEFKPVDREDVIDRSTGTLLMEGMRRLDEMASAYEQGRGIAIPEVDHVRLLEQVGAGVSNGKPATAHAEENAARAEPAASGTGAPSQITAEPSGPGIIRDALVVGGVREIAESVPQAPAGTWSIAELGMGASPEHDPLTGAFASLDEGPAAPGGGAPRTAAPSSRPWTREIDPSTESFFDDDVPVPGLPRTVSRTAKRVVAASVGVAGLICVMAAMRAMSARSERLAESTHRPAASPSLVAQPQLAARPQVGEPDDVSRAAATSAGAPQRGTPEGDPMGTTAPPTVAIQATAEGGSAAAALEATAQVGAAAAQVSAAPSRAVGETSAPGEREGVQHVETGSAEVHGSTEAKAPSPVQARANGPGAANGPVAASGAVRLDSPADLIKRAEEALVQGDNPRAVLLATEAVATSPADAAGWLVLASAHRAMGEEEAARMDYRKCAAQALTAGVNDCRILAANK